MPYPGLVFNDCDIQDEKNNLVFRYDNAPHFPEIDTFPHHKHLPETVIGVKKTSIIDVIKEISRHI